MTKVVLGATKGSIDGSEFDIVDNSLEIVRNYQKDLFNVFKEKNQKVKQIEEEAERKTKLLKSDLVKNLGALYGVKE